MRRRRAGYGAVLAGKLYLITFEAPAIHYFDSGIEAAKAVMASAALRPVAKP